MEPIHSFYDRLSAAPFIVQGRLTKLVPCSSVIGTSFAVFDVVNVLRGTSIQPGTAITADVFTSSSDHSLIGGNAKSLRDLVEGALYEIILEANYEKDEIVPERENLGRKRANERKPRPPFVILGIIAIKEPSTQSQFLAKMRQDADASRARWANATFCSRRETWTKILFLFSAIISAYFIWASLFSAKNLNDGMLVPNFDEPTWEVAAKILNERSGDKAVELEEDCENDATVDRYQTVEIKYQEIPYRFFFFAHNGCKQAHANGGYVHAVSFKKNDNKWSVAWIKRRATETGSFGRVAGTKPADHAERIGPERFAVVWYGGGTFQGNTIEAAEVFEITPGAEGKRLDLEVQNILTDTSACQKQHEDDKTEFDCSEEGVEVASTATFAVQVAGPVTPNGYYDIEVTKRTSTESSQGVASKVDSQPEVQVYRMQNGIYLPQKN